MLFHAKPHLPALIAALPEWLGQFVFFEGDNGVAIFFALSGFVIAHSIRGVVPDARYIGNFALRRSIRLDPPYWASIAFVLLFAAFSAKVQRQPFAFPDASNIVAHIFYLQEFLREQAISSIYWTLTYEIQFYLVLILAVMAAKRLGHVVYVVLFAIAALWGSGLLTANLVHGLFVDRWYGFFLGALSYWSLTSKTSRQAFAALMLIVLLPSLVTGETFRITCALTAGLLFLAGISGKLYTALKGPVLQFLGRISYSLYLTHAPVTGASFFLWRKFAGTGPLPEAIGLIFTFAVCAIVAFVFWFVLERTSLKLAHKIKPRGKTPVSGFESEQGPGPTSAETASRNLRI